MSAKTKVPIEIVFVDTRTSDNPEWILSGIQFRGSDFVRWHLNEGAGPCRDIKGICAIRWSSADRKIRTDPSVVVRPDMPLEGELSSIEEIRAFVNATKKRKTRKIE